MVQSLIVIVTIALAVGYPTVDLHAQAGGSAVPFLLISPDARASGMGECGTAVADNLYAVHWNTGGLAFQRDQQVALSFSR